ncbi:MAG: signal peptidase II, partial [Candidatus Omnitrophica bacterium]|nr:signal peptidase II [Candidatus Omnitrophota bacterium]
ETNFTSSPQKASAPVNDSLQGKIDPSERFRIWKRRYTWVLSSIAGIASVVYAVQVYQHKQPFEWRGIDLLCIAFLAGLDIVTKILAHRLIRPIYVKQLSSFEEDRASLVRVGKLTVTNIVVITPRIELLQFILFSTFFLFSSNLFKEIFILRVAFIFILAGLLAQSLEILFRGGATDWFVYRSPFVHRLAAANIADGCIVTGVGCLIGGINYMLFKVLIAAQGASSPIPQTPSRTNPRQLPRKNGRRLHGRGGSSPVRNILPDQNNLPRRLKQYYPYTLSSRQEEMMRFHNDWIPESLKVGVGQGRIPIAAALRQMLLMPFCCFGIPLQGLRIVDLMAGEGFFEEIMGGEFISNNGVLLSDFSLPHLYSARQAGLAPQVVAMDAESTYPESAKGADVYLSLDGFDTLIRLDRACEHLFEAAHPGSLIMAFQTLRVESLPLQPELARLGYIYSPKFRYYFPSDTDFLRVSEINWDGPSDSDTQNELERLLQLYTFDANYYFILKLAWHLKQAGFRILHNGEVVRSRIVSREPRHSRDDEERGWGGVANSYLMHHGCTIIAPSRTIADGKFFEEIGAGVVVAVKPGVPLSWQRQFENRRRVWEAGQARRAVSWKACQSSPEDKQARIRYWLDEFRCDLLGMGFVPELVEDINLAQFIITTSNPILSSPDTFASSIQSGLIDINGMMQKLCGVLWERYRLTRIELENLAGALSQYLSAKMRYAQGIDRGNREPWGVMDDESS